MERGRRSLFTEFDATRSGAAGEPYGSELEVRRARPADAPAVGLISARREGTAPSRSAETFRRLISECERGDPCIVLVALVGSEVVGFGKAKLIALPDDVNAGIAPEGWYLTGVVVDPAHRRRGVGRRLTRERLKLLASRSDTAYYFANARNGASIALHREFGFVEVARGPLIMGETFEGGEGVLLRVSLGGFLAEDAGVEIRTMREVDREAVSEVLRTCYRWVAEQEGYSAEQLEFLLEERGSLKTVSRESTEQHYVVACIDGTVTGVVSVSGSEVTKLYVEPACHGQGIGSSLMAAAVSTIKAAGFDRVVLGTTPATVPFYQDLGMSVAGTRRPPGGPFTDRDIVIMTLPLADSEGP
ncbi:MAG: GNAT family N-acetyltransferase [Candidatus Eisenbacteria bacterium]